WPAANGDIAVLPPVAGATTCGIALLAAPPGCASFSCRACCSSRSCFIRCSTEEGSSEEASVGQISFNDGAAPSASWLGVEGAGQGTCAGAIGWSAVGLVTID